MSGDININSADHLRFDSQILELQGHKVLVVSGEIDVYSSPQFEQSVNDILAGNAKHLIVDMKCIKYLDSSGIKILLSTAKHLIPDAGTVNLIGCTLAVERILTLTKMTAFVSLHESMDDALKAVSPQTSL